MGLTRPDRPEWRGNSLGPCAPERIIPVGVVKALSELLYLVDMSMIVGDTDEIEEASDEHLSWMLQAMEMVCTNTYA
jgi:hypothetical protein